MPASVVNVDDGRVVIALGKFQLSLAQNEELMREIGQSQLLSVRRTFREQGVPSGSWAPLAPSTLRRMGKKAARHKILIGRGRLLNSIRADAAPGTVTIGTNLVYARVQFEGSGDRSFGIGPRTKEQEGAAVKVAEHYFSAVPRKRRYLFSSYPGTAVEGPARDKGKRPRLRLEGPRQRQLTYAQAEGPANRVKIGEYSRHQNIPPRRYLVFRPEDPARIRGLAVRYIAKAKAQAGLGGAR